MSLRSSRRRIDDAYVVRLLILWFAVATFLQVASDDGSIAATVVGFVAILLLWGIPIHLLASALIWLSADAGE